MSEEWLTTTAAADILDVSVGHVAWLAARGYLHAERRSHDRWVMTRSAVEALAADRVSWVSWDQAASFVGCPRSRIAKAVRDGAIESRARTKPKQPSLRRIGVEAFAATWAEEQRQSRIERAPRAERAAEPAPHPERSAPQDGHVWLTTTETALILGLTRTGVQYRAGQELIPHIRRGNRLWFRRDWVEQAAAAQAFRRSRRQVQPSHPG